MRRDARKYSERLGVLRRAQFQAALDRFGLGRFVSASPVVGGLFGQNVFVSSTTGDYVLRGKPHADWQFPKERFFAQAIHERTRVPVPWPYRLDSGTDIFGWNYILMPRMPGVQIGDPKIRSHFSSQDWRGIARAMGKTLGMLHTLKWPFCGNYDLRRDSIKPFKPSHAERILSEMRWQIRACVAASDRTTKADVAWVKAVISKGQKALRVPFRPACVHHDFRDGNATAERRGGCWRVSGIFDLMECYCSDPEEDLSRSTADYSQQSVQVAREFVRAYARTLPPRPGFAERFPIYMLKDRMTIWRYGQSNKCWFDDKTTLREYAEPFVSLDVF